MLTQTDKTREEMILEHLPLVRFVAQQIALRLPRQIELEDLISSGVIGLIDALEKFDPDRDVMFKTYAEFRIKGEILDGLRVLDPVSRTFRDKQRRLERAETELELRFCRKPTTSEMMSQLGIEDIDEFHQFVGEANGAIVASLDELSEKKEVSPDAHVRGIVCGRPSASVIDALDRKFLYNRALAAVDQLPLFQKMCTCLHYYEELTMREIGEIFAVTESRISQIHTETMLKLRATLNGSAPNDESFVEAYVEEIDSVLPSVVQIR